MRVKEFKNIINNMPDDAEVVIRGQTHKISKSGRIDSVIVASASPVVNGEEQKLVLNPMRKIKTSTWVPELEESVSCLDCLNYEKLTLCNRKGRVCAECNSGNCPCNHCFPLNVDSPVPFKDRNMFEQKDAKN